MRDSIYDRLRLISAPLLLLLWLLAGSCACAWAEEGREAGPDSGLLLEIGTDKAQSYLHEPVTLTVTLLGGPVTLRNIGYPRLKNPAFLLGEFGPPRQRTLEREGRELTAYDFTAPLTPTRSGTLPIGPAELSCELLVPASGPDAFFGGTELRHITVRSPSLTLAVLPLPARGRPGGFSGAVGRFSVTRTAQPQSLRAGEPVTVRTVIRGTGNVRAFACNPISAPGLQSYPPRREAGGNSLSCEQVVIPGSPAVREIPGVVVYFFDPQSQSYRSARSAPVPLRVSAVPAPPTSLPSQPPALVDPRNLGSSYLVVLPAISAGVLLVAGAGGLLLLGRRHLGALTPDSSPDPILEIRSRLLKAEKALDAGEITAFYDCVFRVLQTLIAVRLRLAPAGVTGPLGPDALPAAGFRSACALLAQCDRVRYGSHRPVGAESREDLLALRELVALCCQVSR
jgi:hypothetical protein